MTGEEIISNLLYMKRSVKEDTIEDRTIDEVIKALEQEPCEDAVSRQAVNDLVDELARAISDERCCISRGRSTATIMQDILDLPPVTPKPKTGEYEWVQYDYNPKLGNWHCSECRCVTVECVEKNRKDGIPRYKYCPNCGAKMIEPQKSEDTATKEGDSMKDFEWCTDCKEYDHEKHCCPRFNKVIRTTLWESIDCVLEEIKAEISKLTCGDNEYRQALVKVADVIKCIDKHRAGSEGKG